MQLDQAQIAIRERSWFDNLDLALHVLAAKAKPILGISLVTVLPLAVLNVLFIQFAVNGGLSEDAAANALLLGLLLVMIEAPIATAPLTLYLGQALFVQQPDYRKIAGEFSACLPQLFLFRALLVVLVLPWLLSYAMWPFLNEVILLERNPLVARRGQMSTLKRNSMLHRSGSGDYLARAIGAALLSLLLVLALWTSQNLMSSFILSLNLEFTGQIVALQVSLWLVAVYFTVARFLTYLDQRIRNEGWEVELMLRTQRDRLTRHAA